MLIQSHEGIIDLLPALPSEWPEGEFRGVRARGGFELSFRWENNELTHAEVLSKSGNSCRINAKRDVQVFSKAKPQDLKKYDDGSIEFSTMKGGHYVVKPT